MLLIYELWYHVVNDLKQLFCLGTFWTQWDTAVTVSHVLEIFFQYVFNSKLLVWVWVVIIMGSCGLKKQSRSLILCSSLNPLRDFRNDSPWHSLYWMLPWMLTAFCCILWWPHTASIMLRSRLGGSRSMTDRVPLCFFIVMLKKKKIWWFPGCTVDQNLTILYSVHSSINFSQKPQHHV